ncbi:MAG: negative transcriptional regulator [Herminiimonas sp.]|nr:negative transcriptional regulator [Herminiimonas sp.]
MYIPAHFAQKDPAVLLEVMQQETFATLVSTVDGAPFATHLPVLARQDGETTRIEGHFARANPHWKALEKDPVALVIFHGPHSYISPTLYTTLERVPTWNYVAVHATGRVTLDHGRDAKLGMLSRLVAHHEPTYQAQFDAIAGGTVDGLLQAIVAFDIEVDRLEGKFKLGQHRLAGDKPEMRSWLEQGGEDQRALAGWMKRLGYWDEASG